MTPRPLAFLTDFGHRDPYVGICHGVIRREDQTIPIIDVSHGIPRQDVRAGALALADAAPFMPEQTVFVAVVDPGVGSDRRALAIETEDGAVFVGPDNGLLVPAARLRGGVRAAFEISESAWRLDPISTTFHGRDIFAPVGAKIAAGAPVVESGVAIEHDNLVEIPAPKIEWSGDAVATSVVGIDDFGNVRLAGRLRDLGSIYRGDRVEVTAGQRTVRATAAATYADGSDGSLLLIEDSTGSLSLSISGGNAAADLKISSGDAVRIRRI